jgi:hypothetical protein
MTHAQVPPLRDLPPSRLAERKEHLLAAITSEATDESARTTLRAGRMSRLRRMVAISRRSGTVLAVLLGTAAVATPALAFRSQVLSFLGLTDQAVPPPSFGYLPKGWSTLSDALGVLSRTGTWAEAMALSWHYTPSETGPAGSLPKNGVMIWVHLMRSGSTRVNLCRTAPHFADYPPRTPPLRLPRTTSQTLEGYPHVKEYRVFGRYENYYNYEVRVDIAPAALSPRAFALAQRVVAGIRFPPWPSREDC